MIKESLLRGIKTTIPLLITLMIIYWVFATIEAFFGFIIKPLIPEKYYFTGLGAIIGIATIFIIGLNFNAWIVQIIYR